MKCPGCGSALFDGKKCEACSRLAAELPPQTEKSEQAISWLAMATFWVAIVILAAVLTLHFFADKIWDQEPAFLKWFVIAWGCLVLLRLIYSLAAGKKDERIGAVVMVVIIAVIFVVDWTRADPADASLAELSGKIDRAAVLLQGAEGQPFLARKATLEETLAVMTAVNHRLTSIIVSEKMRPHHMEKVRALQKRTGELLLKQRELLEQNQEESKRLKKTNKQS